MPSNDSPPRDWRKILVGPSQTAVAHSLSQTLTTRMVALGSQNARGAAVFSAFEGDDFAIYVSPRAAELLRPELAEYDTHSSPPPSDSKGLSLSGGDQSVWDEIT